MLELLLAALLSQGLGGPMPRFARHNETKPQTPRDPALQYAFALAPVSELGMPAQCSATAPTTARGAALTFTRASSATCTRGSQTTVANGDLVVLSTDQMRVTTGGTGSKGILLEDARTNLALRSEEFDNAAWTKTNSGAGNMTVTADYAVAPDGTTTADRLQIPAATAAQFSLIYQSPGTGTAQSGGVYFRGTSGSGTLHLWVTNAAANNACVTCSFVSTAWTRCVHENVTTAAGGRIYIGTDPVDCGGGGTSAIDVLAWGAQYESGATVSSYIPTAGASATRAVDTPPYIATSESWSNGSTAATMLCFDSNCQASGEHATISLQDTTTYKRLSLLTTSASQWRLYSTSGSVSIGSATIVANTEKRGSAWWTTTAGEALWGASAGSGTIAVSGTVNRIVIGGYGTNTGVAGGILKDLCADPSAGACR